MEDRRRVAGSARRKVTKLADGRWEIGDGRNAAGGAGGKALPFLYRFFTDFAGEKLSALTRLDYACQNRAEYYRT
jgi:hypothetical protein